MVAWMRTAARHYEEGDATATASQSPCDSRGVCRQLSDAASGELEAGTPHGDMEGSLQFDGCVEGTSGPFPLQTVPTAATRAAMLTRWASRSHMTVEVCSRKSYVFR